MYSGGGESLKKKQKMAVQMTTDTVNNAKMTTESVVNFVFFETLTTEKSATVFSLKACSKMIVYLHVLLEPGGGVVAAALLPDLAPHAAHQPPLVHRQLVVGHVQAPRVVPGW